MVFVSDGLHLILYNVFHLYLFVNASFFYVLDRVFVFFSLPDLVHGKLCLKKKCQYDINILNNQYCLQLLPMYHDLQTQLHTIRGELYMHRNLYFRCIEILLPPLRLSLPEKNIRKKFILSDYHRV